MKIYRRSLLAVAADLVGIAATATGRVMVAFSDLEIALSNWSKR